MVSKDIFSAFLVLPTKKILSSKAALDLGDLNSRMKDFYDIWGLSKRFSFNGRLLQEAIVATCARRKTIIRSEAEIFSDDFMDN